MLHMVVMCFMICCEMNLLSNVEATLVQSSEFDVVSTLCRRCEFDEQFHCCHIVVTTKFIVCHELNLLPNDAATLDQHCKFEVVASMLLQSCVLAVQRCETTITLSQHYVLAG